MKRLLLAAISSLALIAPISFAEPLKVITSFSILEDLAENIGKDKVTVESIIQRDQDAHSFEPTPKDILKIQNADVVILNGADFDNWLARILTANKYEGVIINAGQNVPLLAYGDHGHDHDH
ncbi:MAG TPA: zinc ABC transporter substrate-binding protein, partial [Candidatus Ignatzschineria merdigallinarum]|nr:zinc ABC transporter substrate-binding protein [Candidatus Ignatzschineria merdigallinarum]